VRIAEERVPGAIPGRHGSQHAFLIPFLAPAMTQPISTFLPTPRPVVGQGQAPTYPQGAIRNPYLQVLAARRPIGVGGVADAMGTALGVLEVVGGVALVIIGVDVILKWTGHPLHRGGR
jgi:hypothetical protein